MTDAILVLNAGSSSLKFAVYPAATGDAILKGKVAGIGTDPVFSATDAQGLSLLLAGLPQTSGGTRNPCPARAHAPAP